jgi:hypothetical protein
MFLRLLVLELLLVLLMFGAGGDVRVLFGIDTDNANGNFVADYSPVILANDIDSEFLGGNASKGSKGEKIGTYWDVQRLSSDFSSYNLLSSPFELRRSQLMNVRFELITALIKICSKVIRHVAW